MEDIYKKAIREFMRVHKLNQEEMAKRFEVTPSALSQWFTAKDGISRKNRSKIEFVCKEILEKLVSDECVNSSMPLANRPPPHPELDPVIADLVLTLQQLNKTDLYSAAIAIENIKNKKHEVGAVTQSGEPVEVKRKAGFEGHRRNYVQGLHRVVVNV